MPVTVICYSVYETLSYLVHDLTEVKTECLMPSELKSIFELESPNPEGTVTEKKRKQKTAQRAAGLVSSLLISTTQTKMGTG